MTWKSVLSFIFFLVVMSLLFLYWLPINEISFGSFSQQPGSTNFTSGDSASGSMQFYPNLRYSEKEISYRIENCPLQKTDDMKNAFDIVQSKTILNFYPVSSNEEILVNCESKTKLNGVYFIAGEGGPTNITQAGDFNVIHNGEISLLRDSQCENPNVAIHELLHALGFDHSTNKQNIMYNVSSCNQEIGQDTLNVINALYSIPSNPDLSFENVSASMNGRYLDVSMLIRNNGLKNAGGSKMIVYADDESVKEIDVEAISIGSGRFITLKNILVLQTSVNEVKVSIDYNGAELDKSNNIVSLKIEK